MLKHTEDDGELSVFASGEELLFACSKGHAWIVKASAALTIEHGEAKPNRITRGTSHLNISALRDKFGDDFLLNMRE